MPSLLTDRIAGISTSTAIKAPVQAVTSGNITLATLTPGSITYGAYVSSLVEGTRVLVLSQSDPKANGIYLASTGTWTRSQDFDGARDATNGTLVSFPASPTTETLYEFTSPDNPIVFGTSLITVRIVSTSGPIGGIPQTAAEIAAGVTPTVTTYLPGQFERYGGSTALTDNTLPIQAALNCAQYGQPVLPSPGTWFVPSIASTGNDEHALTFYSNTAWVGPSGGVAIIKLTGIAGSHLLYGRNTANVSFSGTRFYGNSATGTIVGGSYGLGGAIVFVNDTGAITPAGNYRITDCNFDNFGGAYWIYVDSHLSTTYDTTDIRMRGNTFTSYAGNCVDQETQYASDCMVFIGSATTSHVIADVEISGNTAYGQYIKRMVTIWGSTNRFNVHHNRAIGFGTNGFFTDIPNAWNGSITYPVGYQVVSGGNVYICVLQHINHVPPNATYWTLVGALGATGYGGSSCYAFIVYRQSAQYGPDEIVFDSNIIDGVLDCGFYIASAINVTITNNYITGQTSVAETSIPKGAIAVDGCTVTKITDNKMENCKRNITWVGAAGLARTLIATNQITNMPNSSIGVRVITNLAQAWSGATFYAPNAIVISGGIRYYSILAHTNQVPPNATYWTAFTSNTDQWISCEIVGNEIIGYQNSGTIGVDIETTPSYGGRYLRVANNTFDCYRYNFFMNYITGVDAVYNKIDLIGNTSRLGNSGGFYLGNSITPSYTIKGNTFSQGGAFNNSVWHIVTAAGGAPGSGLKGLSICDNDFYDFTGGTGACIICPNLVGPCDFRNNRFANVTNAHLGDASAVDNLGFNIPPWTGNQGAFVQFFQPTEAGGAGNKYMLSGWRWDYANVAWKQVRELTGN